MSRRQVYEEIAAELVKRLIELEVDHEEMSRLLADAERLIDEEQQDEATKQHTE